MIKLYENKYLKQLYFYLSTYFGGCRGCHGNFETDNASVENKTCFSFLKKKTTLILYYKGYSRSFVNADFKRFKSLDMDCKMR